MKKVIIVQARMSSKRLPGKSLSLLAGKPLIMHVIERLKKVSNVDQVVLATSDDRSDDPLVEYVEKHEMVVVRGSLDNVQSRFFKAATEVNADIIVRVTGDNPFISYELINLMLAAWSQDNVDYIGYEKCIYGIGAELFTLKAFIKAISLSKDNYDFEHVTPPFYQKKDLFTTKALIAPIDFCDDSLSLTVDTAVDFDFVEKIFKYFLDLNISDISIPDIVNLWQSGKINRII